MENTKKQYFKCPVCGGTIKNGLLNMKARCSECARELVVTINLNDLNYEVTVEDNKKTDSKPYIYTVVFKQHQRNSYKDLLFDTPRDANNVLLKMEEIINRYGVVTLADLFDLVDIPGNGYVDNGYGWTDVKMARIRVNPGFFRTYSLTLPQPVRIR